MMSQPYKWLIRDAITEHNSTCQGHKDGVCSNTPLRSKQTGHDESFVSEDDLQLALGMSSNGSADDMQSNVCQISALEGSKFDHCMHMGLQLGTRESNDSEFQVNSVSSTDPKGCKLYNMEIKCYDNCRRSFPIGSIVNEATAALIQTEDSGIQIKLRATSDSNHSIGVLVHAQSDVDVAFDEGSTNAAKRMKIKGCNDPALPQAGLRRSAFLPPTEEILTYPAFLNASKSSSTSDQHNDNVSDSGCNTSSCKTERTKKMCKFQGCVKGARGASGLCITHGGGRRCQKPNCNKGAESRTNFCKAHGGGPRCQFLGCIKSAEGKTDYCIGHGGGCRCTYQGCTKASRGKSGLCIRHGGGKRCQREGCTKSAEGLSGLCISHGGGRRCQYSNCNKGAQGSTMFCKGHGGGKRCVFEGCTKGAEGSTSLCKAHGGGKRCAYGGGTCTKSVHGGTAFCVAHGGGKRCSFPGCTKSARGRTDCCVRHGGGKRCQFENCSKSAQGSTDFCKAHGGGGGKKCTGKRRTILHPQSVPSLSSSPGCNVFEGFGEQSVNVSEGFREESVRSVFSDVQHSNGVALTYGRDSIDNSCRSVHGTTESEFSQVVQSKHKGVVPSHMKYSMSFGFPYKRSEASSAPCETLIEKIQQGQYDPLKLAPSELSLFCLSSPEERVHGGGLMALLEKEAAKHRD